MRKVGGGSLVSTLSTTPVSVSRSKTRDPWPPHTHSSIFIFISVINNCNRLMIDQSNIHLLIKLFVSIKRHDKDFFDWLIAHLWVLATWSFLVENLCPCEHCLMMQDTNTYLLLCWEWIFCAIWTQLFCLSWGWILGLGEEISRGHHQTDKQC